LNTILHWKWHQWARVIALLGLIDQATGPFSTIPSSEALVIALFAALCAPPVGTKPKEE